MRRPQGVPVLRCGIIGLGLMGKTHIEVLRHHPYFSLEAVASRRTEMRYLSDELGCRWFQNAEAMLASGQHRYRRDCYAALGAFGTSNSRFAVGFACRVRKATDGNSHSG